MLVTGVLSCLLLLFQRTTADEELIYKNLYGYKDFNITVDPLLLTGAVNFLQKSDQYASDAQPDVTPKRYTNYDFIVIGAGTGGSTIASRLSEIPGINVLLIEAGDEEGKWMDVPLFPPVLEADPNVNWAYLTEPSDKCCGGMVNQQCKVPRGKVMGGSSTINYMIATRGYREDFNRWEQLGNKGWSYDDVLPYFKKLENMLIPELATDKKYHGTKGPVTITYPPFSTPLAEAYLKAAEELGFPIVDINAKDIHGFTRLQSTTLKGVRMSSNRAYLHNKMRNNLHVTKRSMVRKILINEYSKKVFGVEYIKNNRTYTIYANKEVILSAGTVGSPQILMLSGIGPRSHLNEFGIHVIKDLPVGLNFQDHVAFIGTAFTVDQPVSLLLEEIVRTGTPYVRDYFTQQTGPLSVIGGCEAAGFLNAFDPLNMTATPTTEHLFLSTSIGADSTLLDALGIGPEVRKAFAPLQGQFSWSPLSILLKPKSQGRIKLRSANINDKPIIISNYLEHPDDVKTLVASVKIAMEFGTTKAMQRFNSTLFKFDLEKCKQFEGDYDLYMECYVRELTTSVYHLVGTCKMGPENDRSSVVNPRLQVIGIEGLRVVDASIMPEVPSAHTNLPTYMIAEKAADLIKKHWGF